jgi:xanthine dehydrogenase accessory factor
LFLHVQNPPLRLIIVGAVHIAQALAPMAALAGYSVSIIDPRRAFATDARFPDVTLIGEWPDEVMATMTLDRRTAVVTLTHDPKLDDPALQTALKSDVFYVGALGSKRTHAARVGRLRAAGLGEADCARIHGPVGLDIGALSPAEIAVSILAQITQVLRRSADARREKAA